MSRPVVPGYDLRGVLGEGGTAVVWSATRAGDGLPVALKISREPLPSPDPWLAGWAASPPGAEAALAELEWLRELRHPGLVALLDAFVLDDERLVLVLELAEGGSLRDLVRARSHLTVPETVTVLQDLAVTLAALHAREVVHGDLSAGNVLFDGSGRALVADLGTAAGSEDPVDDPWGTAGFSAPEIELGEDPGPGADVWALGALGWFALLGEVRATATDLHEIDARLPEAPEELLDLLRRCLHPDPASRPTAEQVLEQLDSMGGHGVVDVAADPRPQDVTRRVREQAAEQEQAQARARERAAKLEAVRRERERPRLVRRRAVAGAVAVGLLGGVAGAHWWLDGRARPTSVLASGGTVGAGGRPGSVDATGSRSPAGPTPQAGAPRTGPTTGRPVTGSTQPSGPSVHGPTAPDGSAPASPPAAASPSAPGQGPADDPRADPRQVLQGLHDARAQALMLRDAARLPAVDLAGSWAWRQDAAIIDELRRRRQVQDGLRFVVAQARVVATAPGQTTIRATVAREAYSWREPGTPARQAAAEAGRARDYVLRRTPAGWRLETVREVGGPSAG